MTNIEAICTLECMAIDLTGCLGGLSKTDPMEDVLVQRIEAINKAQDALLEKERKEKNEPLTLDELDKMKFEPVYIKNGDIGWYDILYGVLNKNTKNAFATMGYGDYFMLKDYGKTWTAYRYKHE